MTSSPTRTVHVRIEGRVQGVGYRAWTAREASALGLSGWVRNRRDGSVEAVLQGDPEIVGTMLRRCQTGPAEALVTRLAIIGEGVGAFEGFAVRPTG